MSLEDHGEVPEEMSPLPVDGVLEARVVGVQVRAVHQHLLAVVQVTDHLWGVIMRGSGWSVVSWVTLGKGIMLQLPQSMEADLSTGSVSRGPRSIPRSVSIS